MPSDLEKFIAEALAKAAADAKATEAKATAKQPRPAYGALRRLVEQLKRQLDESQDDQDRNR